MHILFVNKIKSIVVIEKNQNQTEHNKLVVKLTENKLIHCCEYIFLTSILCVCDWELCV